MLDAVISISFTKLPYLWYWWYELVGARGLLPIDQHVVFIEDTKQLVPPNLDMGNFKRWLQHLVELARANSWLFFPFFFYQFSSLDLTISRLRKRFWYLYQIALQFKARLYALGTAFIRA